MECTSGVATYLPIFRPTPFYHSYRKKKERGKKNPSLLSLLVNCATNRGNRFDGRIHLESKLLQGLSSRALSSTIRARGDTGDTDDVSQLENTNFNVARRVGQPQMARRTHNLINASRSVFIFFFLVRGLAIFFFFFFFFSRLWLISFQVSDFLKNLTDADRIG